MCRSHGFDRERIGYLHHEILQKACRVPRRLLNPQGTHEGSTRNRTSRAIERGMIRTLGWRVDDFAHVQSGLAEMYFSPRRAS